MIQLPDDLGKECEYETELVAPDIEVDAGLLLHDAQVLFPRRVHIAFLSGHTGENAVAQNLHRQAQLAA
jgi:hypothetical protein